MWSFSLTARIGLLAERELERWWEFAFADERLGLSVWRWRMPLREPRCCPSRLLLLSVGEEGSLRFRSALARPVGRVTEERGVLAGERALPLVLGDLTPLLSSSEAEPLWPGLSLSSAFLREPIVAMVRELCPLCVVRLPRRRVGQADAGEMLGEQRAGGRSDLGR